MIPSNFLVKKIFGYPQVPLIAKFPAEMCPNGQIQLLFGIILCVNNDRKSSKPSIRKAVVGIICGRRMMFESTADMASKKMRHFIVAIIARARTAFQVCGSGLDRSSIGVVSDFFTLVDPRLGKL